MYVRVCECACVSAYVRARSCVRACVLILCVPRYTNLTQQHVVFTSQAFHIPFVFDILTESVVGFQHIRVVAERAMNQILTEIVRTLAQ